MFENNLWKSEVQMIDCHTKDNSSEKLLHEG